MTPYSSNTVSCTFNSVDRVYTQQDGVDSLITLAHVNQAESVSAGLIGTIILKVDSTVDTSSSNTSDNSTSSSSAISSANKLLGMLNYCYFCDLLFCFLLRLFI